MKFKALARSEKKCTRELSSDVRIRLRNTAPELHPFAKAREYRRALNATKLEKVFAKPFVAALDGHTDGVWCSSAPHSSLVQFVSGACDGEVRVWDLPSQKCVWSVNAHRGIVKGVSVAPHGANFFVSAGDDSLAKLWGLHRSGSGGGRESEALATYRGKNAFTGVDHHWTRSHFATSSEVVEVWDHNRSEPIHSFKWGHDMTMSVRFNPAEPDLLASTGRDRSIGLYDVRKGSALKKVVLEAYCSALAWNPREPIYFVGANEDGNLYSFDMRKLDRPCMIHKDHVGAVLSVGYSPTGKEFVSGSYDRTVRIFKSNEGRSREVYHTKRMGRVFCTNFSMDSKFVLSGSDDANVRVWKAQASATLGKMTAREERHAEYVGALKQRHEHMPEVRRIAKYRQVPRVIKKMAERARETKDSARRKETNRRAHSKPGFEGQVKPERDSAVVATLE